MNLRKWSFFLCLWSLLCVLAFWGALRAPIAQGFPGWNTDRVRQQAADLFKKDDYTGLEKLVGEIKSRSYDIRQIYPDLSAFYSVFALQRSDDECHWLDRQTKLQGWLRACPNSLSARIVTADWFIGYAWKARGTGYADSVSDEGWKLMHERLAKAAETLRSVPEEKVDDPEYYRLLISIEVDAKSPKEASEIAFKKGVGMAKEFYPLYAAEAYYLLPRWYGNEGDWEKFSRDCADNFPGCKGDILYALLMRDQAHYYGKTFFQECTVDYDRIKRGFLAEAANGRSKACSLSNLCYLASIQGDNETALKLFLDLGNEIIPSVFGDRDNFERLRKAAGVVAAIDRAQSLEERGHLAEAEKMWLSFHPDTSTSPWLKPFYTRQGMEAKLRTSVRRIDGKTCAEILDTATAQADPDVLANQSRLGPQLGLWEKAEAAAQAFNQKRPWNVTGKNALWLCALHRGDKRQAAALCQEFAALKTDRPSYQSAQAVLKAEKTWAQVRGDLKPKDQYLAQATLAIALYYITQEHPGDAQKVLRDALPLCRETDDKTVMESLLYGSLARSLTPTLAPSEAPAKAP